MLTINYKLSTHPRLLEFLETMKGQDATIIITEDHEYLESKKPKGMYQRLKDSGKHTFTFDTSQLSNSLAGVRANTEESVGDNSTSRSPLEDLTDRWRGRVNEAQLQRAASVLDERNREAGTTWAGDLHSTFGEFSETDARTVNETSSEGQNEEIRYSRGAYRLTGSNGTSVGYTGTITTTPSNGTWVESHNGTTYIANRNSINPSITNPSSTIRVTDANNPNNSFEIIDPIARQLETLTADGAGIGGANLTQLDPRSRDVDDLLERGSFTLRF